MIFAFAYGSNMAARGLVAKGVRTSRSRAARLPGYELAFDLPSVFPKCEGAVANVVEGPPPAGRRGHGEVHGVLHEIDEAGLALLDGLEAIGLIYARRSLPVVTYDGEEVKAETYVGLPSVREEGLRPSTRYIRILVDGATEQALDASWIQALRDADPHVPPSFGRFQAPATATRTLDAAELAENPSFVALHGVVFDLTEAIPIHRVITRLRGGQDLTPVAIALGAGVDASLDETVRQETALHQLQHELAQQYPVVGRYLG